LELNTYQNGIYITKSDPGGIETMPSAQEERTFATRLAQFREARGLSQKQLAARVGCPPDMISKYEGGQRVPRSPERYFELSAALAVSPVELLGVPPESGSRESAELAAWVYERTLRLNSAQVRALLVFFCAALARSEGEPPAAGPAPGPGGAA
jgi:transcriptional regulator with XRE-family HTH domain